MSDSDAGTGDDDLAGHFRWLADWCEGTSLLYERLCRGVADDPEVLALATEVPDERSPPHVLLAAVHYLLLRGTEHELAEFYRQSRPSGSGSRGSRDRRSLVITKDASRLSNDDGRHRGPWTPRP